MNAKKFFEGLGVVAWYAMLLIMAAIIGYVVYDAARTPLLAAPAVIVFLIASFMVGRPYASRPPGSRWVLRVRMIPTAERTRWWRRLCPVRVVRLVKLKQRFTVWRTAVLSMAAMILFGTLQIPGVWQRMREGTGQSMNAMVEYDPVITTRIFAKGGEQVCAFYDEENRVLVPLEKIPLHVRQAFIAAEDKGFYEHGGVDPIAIARAYRNNSRNPGGRKQGGSGITQQTVKQVVLQDGSTTMSRKIQEAWISIEVEKQMSKDDILRVYLNQSYFGHHAYGVQAAAMTYFGKDIAQVSLAEAAILAGLPKAPDANSPYKNFERSRVRQVYVLGQMVKAGFITQAQADAAKAEEVLIISHEDELNKTAAPYFCRKAYNSLKEKYGVDAIFKRGMTVETSLDKAMQDAADVAVKSGLISLERRIGFNGPEGHDDAYKHCEGLVRTVTDGIRDVARVASVGDQPTVCLHGTAYPLYAEDVERIRKWSLATGKHLAVGDIMSVEIVTVTPEAEGRRATAEDAKPKRYAITARRSGGPDHPEALQAALIAFDQHTGELLAYVGGYDFNESNWDNISMARRQPGSSIKPYVYLTALMKGLQPDTEMNDGPNCYATASGVWCPQNYKGPTGGRQYYGRVNLKKALAQSLNSISVQLAAKYGIEDVIDTMRALGINSPLERVLPLAVGAAELTLWEHTAAYGSFIDGKRLPQHPWSEDRGLMFRRITDARGRVLYEAEQKSRDEWPQAVPAANAAALTYLLEGVVETGTGKRLKELQRPAAAKTGTANEAKDVGFISYTDDIVVGVWVGRQLPEPITKDATGGSVALPIALAAMMQMHPKTPARAFPMPDDVVLVRDAVSGDLIPYQRGHVPDSLLRGSSVGSLQAVSPR